MTIAVFLFVAVVIAIRSCLRRREQQRMVEGIRNGTQVPPTRTNKPDTRRKPGMFEIWFLKDDGGDSGDGVGQGGSGKGRGHSAIHPKEQQEWNDIVVSSKINDGNIRSQATLILTENQLAVLCVIHPSGNTHLLPIPIEDNPITQRNLRFDILSLAKPVTVTELYHTTQWYP